MRGLWKRLWATSVRFAAETARPDGQGEDAKAVLGDLRRVIQRCMIPAELPSVDGFTFAADAVLRDDGRGSAMWEAFPPGDGRMVLEAISVIGETLPPAHHLAVVPAVESDFDVPVRRSDNARQYGEPDDDGGHEGSDSGEAVLPGDEGRIASS